MEEIQNLTFQVLAPPSKQIESFLFGAKGTGPLKVIGLRFSNASLNKPF